MKEFIFWFCLLVSCSAAFGQEPTKQSQTLITEKRSIMAAVKLPSSETVKLRGEASYQIGMVNSDDTLMGKFVFTLSEKSRQLLAAKTDQTIAQIPRTIESGNVVAEFAKKTTCPEIHLEMQSLIIKLTENISVTFEHLKFDLKETPQEISALMCKIAYSISFGRVNTRGVRLRANQLLKREAAEN